MSDVKCKHCGKVRKQHNEAGRCLIDTWNGRVLEDTHYEPADPPQTGNPVSGKVILGVCKHLQTYPFHNTTNGEKGKYCLDCGPWKFKQFERRSRKQKNLVMQ